MGSTTSTSSGSATVDTTEAAAAPTDNLRWIMSSLKSAIPHLTFESVLLLHNVSKLVNWHVHNLHTWRALCLRDFPDARSRFRDRTSTTDADAKACYYELFCQRFILEAEVCLHSHCAGRIGQQMPIQSVVGERSTTNS